jgi:flagellar protein FlbD
MIKLTKFNSKEEFILNADIIETIERTPDTVITLTNGKKVIVEEGMEAVVREVMRYKRAMFSGLSLR